MSLAHLLNIADHGAELEPLALGVDGVQPPHQVLQEQLEDLRQAQHRLVTDHEGCDLLPTIVDNLAIIGRGVIWADHGWGRLGIHLHERPEGTGYITIPGRNQNYDQV